jgi:hypothetical protein
MAEITDGTSNTFMVGEKFLNPKGWITGLDSADNENLYTGFDNDHFRSSGAAYYPPRADTPALSNLQVYGSPHPGGFCVVLCDGSVRVISYQIDKLTFAGLGNKGDGMQLGDF